MSAQVTPVDILLSIPCCGQFCGDCTYKLIWTLVRERAGRCELFDADLFRPSEWPQGIESHRALLRCRQCLEAQAAASSPRQLAMVL